MTDARIHNRPPVPQRALSDAEVAAVDYMVHELGARQWKVAMRIGKSHVTVGHAVNRRGAYANVPPYQTKEAS